MMRRLDERKRLVAEMMERAKALRAISEEDVRNNPTADEVRFFGTFMLLARSIVLLQEQCDRDH
jgi:hypothetical protein